MSEMNLDSQEIDAATIKRVFFPHAVPEVRLFLKMGNCALNSMCTVHASTAGTVKNYATSSTPPM